jgi:uncharacterized protein
METQLFVEAHRRARDLGVRNVLVATNTGESVEMAQDAMGPSFHFYAVGNPTSSRAEGLVLHCGISQDARARLEARGITVVMSEVSAFTELPGNITFHRANRAYIERFGRTYGPDEVIPQNICKVMTHALSEFFGDGPRVCMEIALMAADSGELPLSEDCMAIARPRRYAHTAMVVTPVTSEHLFGTQFRVKNLLLVPGDDDIWFNGGPIP